MNTVVRSIIAIIVLVIGSRGANAACVIGGVKPTVTLPTMTRGQDFLFVATDDCEELRFSVRGTGFSKIPNAGPDKGSKDRTYKVVLTESEWTSLVQKRDRNFTWSITGETSAGVTTRVTTTNELDVDRDGWTRSEGDVGVCDHSSIRNPGVAELCDGKDQDCDGLIDEDVSWFRDADGDGYGDDADKRCDWAEGYVDVGGDCDDTDSGLWCSTLDLSMADAELGGAGTDAGDVNGDGNDDLLVAGYTSYVVLGPVSGTVDLLSETQATLVGEASDMTGWSVSGAGDVDGDGHDDLLVGAPGDTEGGYWAGAAYLVEGPVTGEILLSSADAKLVGPYYNFAGGDLAGVGDVDGDGNDDVLIGAYLDSEGGSLAGAAYLVLGPVTGTFDLSTAQAKLVGEEAYDAVGLGYGVWGRFPVSAAGDVNGDGTRDLLVGGYGNDEGGGDAGAAYLVLGPVTGTLDLSLADAKLMGEAGSFETGGSVSGDGDVDGDGYSDVLIGGAWGYDGRLQNGTAYLVLGPVSGKRDLSAADAVFVGEARDDYAGWRVAVDGDVDADGHADLLIGSLAGASYLLRGPVEGTVDLELADIKFVGAGRSVSGGGDFDADGLDDVFIDAYVVYGSHLSP